MEQVYLTRRNLMTLLAKLNAKKAGEQTHCEIVKHDIWHPKYPCSAVIRCVAVEDEDYYTDRRAGGVHPREEAALRAASEILKVL